MKFSINVNSEQVARDLNIEREEIESQLKQEIKTLAARTHAFIIAKANSELKGFMREHYLGRQSGNLGANLKLHHISDTLHVIELDQKAHWIEDGRPATFIGDWVLKSPKAKIAKDGSKYIAIPFKLASLKGNKTEAAIPALETMAKAALKATRPKIHMTKTQYGSDGRPLEGKIKNIEIEDPGRHVAGFHSKARSPEMAALTGLPAHEGIFMVKALN